MKYIQKTIIFSLVLSLVSFAGGFCMHPMMAEAHTSEMSMEIEHSSHTRLPVQDCLSLRADEASHTINVCAVDCITTLKVTSTKKAVVEHTLQISSIAPPVDSLETFSGRTFVNDDVFGVPPPSPDILSSVFKRE